MCKSRTNLEEYGGERFSMQKINSDLYRSVLNKYYPNKGYYDIWIIENIHDLCDKALDYDRFIVSELYHVLDKLYELCEWIILWYGDEYEDLKEIHTKKEFINYVRYCVEKPCCEIYAKVYRPPFTTGTTTASSRCQTAF